MRTYVIKYNDGNKINKRVEVQGKTMCGALMVFLQQNQNAEYESIDVKESEVRNEIKKIKRNNKSED